MKKLLGIVIISLSFSFNCIAGDNIYYCADEQTVGFNAEKSGTKVINFIDKKFKAKIDFENRIFESNDIGNRTKWLHMPSRNFFTDGMTDSIKFYDKVNMKYFRSFMFVAGDSAIFAMGSCTKF